MNFFAYRDPAGHTRIFSSERILPGLHPGGFVIAPFTPGFGEPETIPADTELQDIPEIDLRKIHAGLYFPAYSTTREEHRHAVTTIIDSLSRLPVRGKAISARVLMRPLSTGLREMFRRLCESYPTAFVFTFYSDSTGLWIGATPETLLEIDSNRLHTMALAGTRPSGSIGEWDEKNLEEQEIVSKYIFNILNTNGLNPVLGKRHTKSAGPVEHICTEIEADVPADLTSLLRELSPTPALGGYPRDVALRLIDKTEDFRRFLYGGYIGPYLSPGRLQLYVNLRSGCIADGRIALYAGGGITPLSNPDAEWLETERKLSTMLSILS